MSDIPRYKPVPDDRFGIADDADGKLCEYRHYEQLKSTVQSFAANVLRLGNEVRDLAKERDALKEHIKYLEIELKCETGRWERTMEDNAKLKDENEELHKDYESLADEHTKLIDRNKTLKDELRKRALDSLSDIGQLGEQSAEIASLKAEVERLTDCQSEADRLKAEVEAHEKRWAESEDLISHYKQQRDEAYNDCQCHRLKAEVERLRKDSEYERMYREVIEVLKEGKQP
jgi:chromosome segregation ATPase